MRGSEVNQGEFVALFQTLLAEVIYVREEAVFLEYRYRLDQCGDGVEAIRLLA